jgi:uncharacterized membrane protein (UPF0127 family)
MRRSVLRTLVVVSVSALALACRRSPEELPPAPVETSVAPKAAPNPVPPPDTAAPKAAEGPQVPGCPKDPDPPTEAIVKPIEFPEAKVRIDAEIARTEHEVTRGLMYRTSMPEYRGMLFRMPRREEQIFWMRNTCISLDMLFLDDDGTIVGILENVPILNEAQRTVHKPSRYVLELNGGFSKAHGLRAGMKAVLPQ